jgi:type IV secretory pathway VirD2 relaxase
MADKELRARLRSGRVRSEDSAHRAKRLRAALARGRRAGRATKARTPSRSWRSARSALSSPLVQRSIVKVRFVANRARGGWRAHGRYLSREGAQRDGERGRGFDASSNEVSIEDRLGLWQKAGDSRLWKVIVSPEQAQRLDLREHTRELVAAIEGDLGTRLEWTAIDHHNTTHPHVHVVIRGVRDDGRVLAIANAYVREGIRARSQELATRSLGYRTEHDRDLARERAVSAPHFGELDAILAREARAHHTIVFDDAAPASPRQRALRVQLIGRLGFLEGAGLATRLGPHSWTLFVEHRPALEQMQLLRDVTKSVARGEVMLEDPDSPKSLVALAPGDIVRGRVAGVVRLDVEERAYLVLEATDGRVLLVAETAAMERRRREGALERGTIVTLSGREARRSDGAARWIEVHPHGALDDMAREPSANTTLDQVALERATAGEDAPLQRSARGFAARWREAIARRVATLEQVGLMTRDGSGALRPAPGAVEKVRRRALARDHMPMALADVGSTFNKPVRDLSDWSASGSIAGKLVAFAQDEHGRGHVVLDVGPTLYVLATERRDLTIGARIEGWHQRARDVADASEYDRSRGRAWKLADLSRELDRGRGR